MNGALFEAGVVNELNVTICPVVFGGRGAPTIVDGEGIKSLKDATRLKCKRMEQVGGELYCVFRVEKETTAKQGTLH